MNLRLDLAYDGGAFKGFARQPDQRTVQGEVETALRKLFRVEAVTVGAGRTDAGVHAWGQVISTDAAPDDIDPFKVRDALNAMLAPAIAVHNVTPVAPDFNARFSARSRTYLYGLLRSATPDPFLAPMTWYHPDPLDLGAMREAAGHLVGERDFSSFGRAPDGGHARRTLFELSCERHGELIRIRARANAFIQQMVRSLVGTLVYVGRGRRSPDEVPGIIESRDRASAGPVAPPQGLCLVAVEYDDGWSPLGVEHVV